MTSAAVNEKNKIILPSGITIRLHTDADTDALPEYDMTTRVNLRRKVSDTRRITFIIEDDNGEPVDITDWVTIIMSITSIGAPADGSSLILQMAGVMPEGCGINGEVYFVPPGSIGVGKHFYDCQAMDENNEKITFAQGRYILEQDRTKV